AGTTLDEYTSGTWTGPRSVSQDDYQRIIDAMEASAAANDYLALLDADSSGAIDLDEVGALTLSSTASAAHGGVIVYRIMQTEQAPLAFKTMRDAFFIKDSWIINQHWTVNAGIRAEPWDHVATDGTKVYTFDSDIATRLRVVYDINGDG